MDALCELTDSEIDFRKQQAITDCVKVANFPFLKEIGEFDFSFQPSLDKAKIMNLMTFYNVTQRLCTLSLFYSRLRSLFLFCDTASLYTLNYTGS